jgi:ribosome-associated protein
MFGEFSHRMTTEETRQQTRILVQAAAAVCEDKKGEDTRILELDPVDAGLSDFFLITSATNNRQSIAIADEIEYRIKKEFGIYPNSVEGRRLGEWILLDYVDFVVHVFLAERRAFYDIERLRKSARPLTPAEFDAELKAALSTKTLAVRKKATAKPAKVAVAAKAAKKAVVVAAPAVKKPIAKKAVAKKVIVKKTVTKKAAPKKAVASKAAPKKTPAKKVVIKKAAAKKPVAKKTAGKKVVAKKAPAKKVVAKKPVAKKAAPKKVVVKKVAKKKR